VPGPAGTYIFIHKVRKALVNTNKKVK
jgi:hypothetical protein